MLVQSVSVEITQQQKTNRNIHRGWKLKSIASGVRNTQYIERSSRGTSSIGRARDSKSRGWGFESSVPRMEKSMDKLRAFLKGVRQEIDRVSWPGKKLVQKATVGVIIFSLFFGIYLWVMDLAFTRVIRFLLLLRSG